jgi:hypothetical protein
MISNALRAGLPASIVAEQARVSLRVMLQTYSHVLASDKRSVSAVFDQSATEIAIVPQKTRINTR